MLLYLQLQWDLWGFLILPQMALSSKYVETQHRGKFNSFINITKILGTATASCLVTWGVITNNNIIFNNYYVLHIAIYFY